MEDSARSQGVLTGAVQDYIDKLFAVPPVVQTKAEVDGSQALATIANLKIQLGSVQDRTVTMTVINDTINNSSVSDTGTNVGNNGAARAHAFGGWIMPAYFAGGGMANQRARGTDTLPSMLTPGEFTVQRSSAQALERESPGALDYINRNGRLPAPSQQPVVGAVPA